MQEATIINGFKSLEQRLGQVVNFIQNFQQAIRLDSTGKEIRLLGIQRLLLKKGLIIEAELTEISGEIIKEMQKEADEAAVKAQIVPATPEQTAQVAAVKTEEAAPVIPASSVTKEIVMGEYLRRDASDPNFVPDGAGMNAEQAKIFAAMAGVSAAAKPVDPKVAMAQMIAAQTGKTVEEVLAFMGAASLAPAAVPAVEDKPILEEVGEVKPAAAVVVPVAEIPGDDKFIVTEIVDLEDASEADLNKLALEEEDDNVQDWSGKIRQGSKVKVVYMVSASRINWIGKKGKVVRIIGNEAAKVFDVEFNGGKIPKIRLNKKTGKLERGYEKKVIRNTFSEDQLELDN